MSDVNSERSISGILKDWHQPMIALGLLLGLVFAGAYALRQRDHDIAKLRLEVATVESSLKKAVTTGVYRFDTSKTPKGRFATGVKDEQFPVAVILGWHQYCPGVDRDERGLESLFIEPDRDGVWSVYVEQESGCQRLEVGVAFVGEGLALTGQGVRREKPGLGPWPDLKLDVSGKSKPRLSSWIPSLLPPNRPPVRGRG